MAVGLFYPELQVCLLAAAFLIAASRIILGMHFLSDVLAGSAIGVLGLRFSASDAFCAVLGWRVGIRTPRNW